MTQPHLEVSHVSTRYGGGIVEALNNVSLSIQPGEMVALFGANGAGKSTCLKSISGLIRATGGQVTDGEIRYQGQPVTRLAPDKMSRLGVAHVLEGRHCFPHLTVEENLRTGAIGSGRGRKRVAAALEEIYERFPRLKPKRHLQSGNTSGGEQQMTAIGRALLTQPRLLILDEPSMGLAPNLYAEIFESIRQLNRESGISVLIAEQNVSVTLPAVDSVYLLDGGRVTKAGPSSEFSVSAIAVHIPAHREHPFRTNVNTYSGST
uniref:ABC transporter ATP-binding protein n=1 Tax=Marinobacter nauticus TaxID=2743 RepID=A0A455W4L4_MARNT|nr:ABC transporter ATP-binding protein [Marinobacter nauticus]